MPAAVEFRHVSKIFGATAVINDVSLAIPEKSFVTFLGPSGCGKTTLLRMIAGFYEPDAGEVLINGRVANALPAYQRNTAMVFQEYALFPHLSVYDNVAYGLRTRGDKEADIAGKVADALRLIQLEKLGDRYPNQLSGGQQQRVAVARALVMNPVALLLDEPLSNLDAKLRESVRVELRAIQQQLRLTAVYVTHDQSEAFAMSDLIVVMHQGRIEQVGKPKDIYYRPASRFVADFIGTANVAEVTALPPREAEYRGIRFPVEETALSGSAYASIRPESILLSNQPAAGLLSLPARVKASTFLGEKSRYFLEDEHGKDWIADHYDSRIEYSGKVYMLVKPEHVHLVDH